jgi:hypothetical protein
MITPRLTRNRLPFLMLALYTALSVAGSFSLGAVEQIRSVTIEVEHRASGGILASPERYLIPCAVGPVFMTKTTGTPVSPQRAGFERLFSFSGLPSSGGLLFRAKNDTPRINPKNNILLKLRI